LCQTKDLQLREFEGPMSPLKNRHNRPGTGTIRLNGVMPKYEKR